MAKYSDIKGFTVQTLSTDPASSLMATGSWSTGGNIPANKMGYAGGGSMTAAIVFGGNDTFSDDNSTYEYDGAAWTAGGNMSEGIGYGGGGGSQTSAIAMGGYDSGGSVNTSEEYDGSSWTAGGNMNIEKYNMGASVIGQANTDASVIGGRDGPSNAESAKQENYNGTAWTEIGDLPAASYAGQATGTTTAAIYFAGTGYTKTGATWNGSTWTTNSATLNTDRTDGALSGSSTDALIYGGYPPGVNTEYYNGSSWTEVGDLANPAPGKQGRTTQTTDASTALAYGGYPGPTGSTRTEEWTLAATPTTFKPIVEGQLYFNSTTNTFKETISDVPNGSWASGTNLSTVRSFHAMAASSSDAAIAFGGNPGSTANTEQYDGSSWTEKNNLNTGRNSLRGFGTVSAAIGAGGYAPTGTMDNVESWDGTNWTEVNEINSARQLPGRGGTQTAGILFGGYTTTKSAVTETWDGTSWTEVADMNTSGDYISSFGSQTSAIAGNRYQPGVSPGYSENNVETWNGSSWTETAEMNTARAEMSGEVGATGDLGLIAGGTPNGAGPAKIANTELWNGSSWTEVNDLGTARRNYGAGGPSSSGILTGGDGDTDGTEEWTVDLVNKTITAS